MKAYTDLEQAKTLAKMLPLESADMYYEKGINDNYRIDFGNYADISISKNLLHIDAIPCWSFSALLELIPNWQMQTQDNGIGILYGCKEEVKIIEGETPLDAAFQMVCWLKENNKI